MEKEKEFCRKVNSVVGVHRLNSTTAMHRQARLFSRVLVNASKIKGASEHYIKRKHHGERERETYMVLP